MSIMSLCGLQTTAPWFVDTVVALTTPENMYVRAHYCASAVSISTRIVALCAVLCVRVCLDSPHGLWLGTLTAHDPEGDSLEYRLTGAMTAPFSLLRNGSLVYNSSLGLVNYEVQSSYVFTVVARETGTAELLLSTNALTVVVTVTNVNEAPYIVTTSHAFVVSERAGVSAVDDTFASVLLADAIVMADPDAADAPFVEVVEVGLPTTPPPFAVLPNGSIAVLQRLNFERKSLYTLSVRVVDSFGRSTNDVVTITVVDGNDRPVIVCGPMAVEFDETTLGPVPLGLTGSDEDVGDAVIGVVTGRSAWLSFVTLLTTGTELGVANVALWIPPGLHWLEVEARDGAGASSLTRCNVSVSVVDVNDRPSFAAGSVQSTNISEATGAGAVVATLFGYDLDEAQVLTYQVLSASVHAAGVVSPSLVGTAVPTDVFRIVSVNSRVSQLLLTAAVLDARVVSAYKVVVEVRDDGGGGVVQRGGGVTLASTMELTVTVVATGALPSILTVGVSGSWDSYVAEPSTLGRRLRLLGGDAIVVHGFRVGSDRPGGLNVSAGSFEVWYWDGRLDGSSSPSARFHSKECRPTGEPRSDGSGVLVCESVRGFGVVTSVQVSVSGRLSAVLVLAPSLWLSYEVPVVSAVSPNVLTTAGGQVAYGCSCEVVFRVPLMCRHVSVTAC